MLDQLVRYEPVVAAASRIVGGSLIDVGSGSVGIAPWLSRRWSVTSVDESFSDYGSASGPQQDALARRVWADARALPFPDGSFDVGVALDLIEHLPVGDRATVLAELARVTQGRMIVGCPTGPAALESDARLRDRCAKAGEPLEWLDEHVRNGFPEPSELQALLEPYGRVELIANESVRTHQRLMRFEFTRVGGLTSRAAAKALRPFLRDGARGRRAMATVTRRLLRGGDRPPAYRTIAVVDRA